MIGGGGILVSGGAELGGGPEVWVRTAVRALGLISEGGAVEDPTIRFSVDAGLVSFGAMEASCGLFSVIGGAISCGNMVGN